MGGGAAWRLVAGLLLIAGANGAAEAATEEQPCAERAAVPEHIRPLDCEVAASVALGLARSATFRDLVERIRVLNGIVYVRPRPFVHLEARRVLAGALLHQVTPAGTHRLLQVLVAPAVRGGVVAVLAHEFQHAVELLEAGVTSEAQADALFERIGQGTGAGVVETDAAIEVERLVRRELAGG